MGVGLRVAAVTASLGFLVLQAAAQIDRPWLNPGTRQFASCLDDQDRPICILRVAAASDVHEPYRYDDRFAARPDILALLEPFERPEDDSPELRVFRQTSIEPTRQMRLALASAFRADAQGARPDIALAPLSRVGVGLEARSFAVFASASGAELRCLGYVSIWERFDGKDGAPPTRPRPSERLTRAALAACERELPIESEIGADIPAILAAGYVRLGDTSSARRVMRFDPRPPYVVNIETALLLGDVNEAALAAVSGQAGIVTEVGRSQAVGVWVRLVTASLAAERSDIAVQTAYHAIEEMFRWPVDRYGPDIFIETVAGYGPPVRAHALAERFDRAGRDTDSALSLSAATQAVVGWTALGERARAQALINLWTPRAQAERAQPVCGGQAPFCVGDGFAHMLRVTDQLNSAWELTRLTPAQAITFDIADGRGLSRLEEHLARAGDARTAEQALSVCASDYATPLDIAEQCARLLVARAADRPLTAHEESLARYSNFAQTGPHGAASAMLTIAQRAARAGEAEVSDRSLAEALRIWSSAPDAQTELPQLIALQDIARRQLERQGRF